MILEERLMHWIKAQAALSLAQPIILESVFWDTSQVGYPSAMAPGVLTDLEKDWIPDEYAPRTPENYTGQLRWAGHTFPIHGNTAQQLFITGDPSLYPNVDNLPYQIVPPSVAGLTQLLQQAPIDVLTTFAQVPTTMPAITIRLEKEEQAETYVGESLEHYAVDGVEFDVRYQAIQGQYLLSIWSVNRDGTLWLYAWLQNAALRSMGQFASWGLYDVSLAGSDLDPSLQYLAERSAVRHLLVTATRQERAVLTKPVEWVSDVCVKVCAAYANIVVRASGME